MQRFISTLLLVCFLGTAGLPLLAARAGNQTCGCPGAAKGNCCCRRKARAGRDGISLLNAKMRCRSCGSMATAPRYPAAAETPAPAAICAPLVSPTVLAIRDVPVPRSARIRGARGQRSPPGLL